MSFASGFITTLGVFAAIVLVLFVLGLIVRILAWQQKRKAAKILQARIAHGDVPR